MHCLCRPSRIMSVRINLLDETDFIHEIKHWLDPASRISRQLKPKPDPYDLYFGVKFYAPDPCKLVEEITRYQLFLQVKQDVLKGKLPVAFEWQLNWALLLCNGEDSVEYFLGLPPSGIVVLRNKTTVAHYYWPRIAKVYYKGRYFMLRISDKNNELSTYGFETPRKSGCKHLWRCCMEHNAFFRLMRVPPTLPNSPTNTSDISQLGSRLKCSKEKSSKDSLFINRSPPAFVRVPSKRQPRRLMDYFLNGCKIPEQFCGN